MVVDDLVELEGLTGMVELALLEAKLEGQAQLLLQGVVAVLVVIHLPFLYMLIIIHLLYIKCVQKMVPFLLCLLFSSILHWLCLLFHS